MREIQLTQGKTALVDDADFEWLNQWKWFYANGYAVRKVKGKQLFMHKAILGESEKQGDHINGKKLDNRRSNLRLVTQSENAKNRKLQVNNTSGFRGVHQDDGRWRATIRINKMRKSLGGFDTPQEASQAYNKAAEQFFGEYRRKE